MTESVSERATDEIEVVAYDPAWVQQYLRERERVLGRVGPALVQLEHIGSTAVPGLTSKPVIDMMAAVTGLTTAPTTALAELGYELVQTGMRNRLFLRHYDPPRQRRFHLHLVEAPTWETRKERLMRDYLLRHPEAMRAYGELKSSLVTAYRNDPEGYTRAKTAFIQGVIDRARAEGGLPAIDVWNEE